MHTITDLAWSDVSTSWCLLVYTGRKVISMRRLLPIQCLLWEYWILVVSRSADINHVGIDITCASENISLKCFLISASGCPIWQDLASGCIPTDYCSYKHNGAPVVWSCPGIHKVPFLHTAFSVSQRHSAYLYPLSMQGNISAELTVDWPNQGFQD